jgi:hypothetical protein
VGKRRNTSVFKSVFLTAKITLEFYKKSDPKNFHTPCAILYCLPGNPEEYQAVKDKLRVYTAKIC